VSGNDRLRVRFPKQVADVDFESSQHFTQLSDLVRGRLSILILATTSSSLVVSGLNESQHMGTGPCENI